MNKTNYPNWLCLAIGNSRYHWAWFVGETLKLAWDCSHLSRSLSDNDLPLEVLPPGFSPSQLKFPVYLASVVPQQTALWQKYSPLSEITLAHIPLHNIYPTLGIDRALAVWGGGITYGFPCLVIDAGTALTFTGVDRQQNLIGGAILPGSRLQLQSLGTQTAALPAVKLSPALPQRWALDTKSAIASGIVYSLTATIRDFCLNWLQKYPQSSILLTGGDSAVFLSYLKVLDSDLSSKMIEDSLLIFWGFKQIITQIK